LTVVNLIVFRTKIFQVPAGLFVWVVVAIAVLTAVAVDAARQARCRSNPQAPNSRWTVVMVSTIILILAVGFLTSRIGLPASSKPFKVSTASMCPTICEGERIVADMEAYKDKPPEPGDLVMLEINPGNPLFIKRVIAVGGDIVKQGSHGEVLVNGIPIPQPTICSSPRMPTSEGMTINFAPVTVPAGSFFVVGDNPTHSADSRVPGFGFPNADQMRGRPLYLYWSTVPSRIGCKVR
jgi:signal peptidase I